MNVLRRTMFKMYGTKPDIIQLTHNAFPTQNDSHEISFPIGSILNTLSREPVKLPKFLLTNKEFKYIWSRSVTDNDASKSQMFTVLSEQMNSQDLMKTLKEKERHIKPRDMRFKRQIKTDIIKFREMVAKTSREVTAAMQYNYGVDLEEIKRRKTMIMQEKENDNK
ncbi:hypothetical protein ROZALSC1DRAFT_31279 [Rozella allomycis CSF55]|uniref:Uncharacterized protein n=1 Tax=Rozella allomycis (strain CSF55) TaxID=988480 RepID=A0A075AT60_ROZAC|nr:hypothetical protein O9G_001772 [Rozella allomycis CSF55]RKP16866.1 hypothetical protein ROZALSC1DRAFT_31279 [Rozella allomycis CSF55]|eukprot:EPZ33360.1 hypothetical protein O9G_001772 [Rozella allomycis CSF55]